MKPFIAGIGRKAMGIVEKAWMPGRLRDFS
jgi:hypothetical protein